MLRGSHTSSPSSPAAASGVSACSVSARASLNCLSFLDTPAICAGLDGYDAIAVIGKRFSMSCAVTRSAHSCSSRDLNRECSCKHRCLQLQQQRSQ